MANKSQYRTKQMAEILSYLQSMQGSHVTVHDIHAYFKSKNISVGTTTIYRHLDRMVAEGIVAKYVVDEKSSAFGVRARRFALRLRGGRARVGDGG